MLFDPSFPYYAMMPIETGFLLFLWEKKSSTLMKFESFKF